MMRSSRMFASAALAMTGATLGCTQPPPNRHAANTCHYYTGSRLCLEPEEVSSYVSCDAVGRSVAEGTVQERGALSCDGSSSGIGPASDAQIPVTVHR